MTTMLNKRFTCVFLFAHLLLLGFAAENGMAQEDPLQDARNYPASFFKASEQALVSLNWQIDQLESLTETYLKAKVEISQEMSMKTSKMEELYRQLPDQFGSADPGVLADLIGNAMKQRMELRLELVALEAQMAGHQENIKQEADLLQYRREEFAIATAKAAKLATLAEAELKKEKMLFDKGTLSRQQLLRATTSAEIAKMEFRAAEVREKVEMQRAKAAASSALADARLAMNPIKAKLKVIDEFLANFSVANKTGRRIDEHKRELELLHRDLELVAEQLFDLGRQQTELTSLKRLMLQDLKNNGNESDAESTEKD